MAPGAAARPVPRRDHPRREYFVRSELSQSALEYRDRHRDGGCGGVMINAPSASYSVTVRLEITNRPGMLGNVTSAIGKAGGDIGAIDLVEVGKSTITRDLTFKASDERHGQQVVDSVRAVAGVRVINASDRTFLMHLGGKIEVRGKMAVKTRDDLSMAYTPGVARVCMAIHQDPEKAYTLTIKQNF